MRYFYKLLLSMLLLLTAALAVTEYYAVAIGLGNSFGRELDSGLGEHQLVKHAVQTAVLNAEDSVSNSELTLIGESAAELLEGSGGLLLCASAEETTYYTSLSTAPELSAAAENTADYQVLENDGGSVFLVVRSSFTQSNQDLTLVTERDITQIFTTADSQRGMYTRLNLALLAVCAAMAVVLAYALTRPLSVLRRTSERFSAGDYTARSNLRSRDEVGELAATFDGMAGTIEAKMGELEESVARQKRFTASFAHELKTPMTSIIGYADTIYQKDLTPEETRQAAWYIVNEGMRLEALSFKLMDLIALEKNDYTLEETEISTLLQDTAETAAPLAEKRGVRFTVQAEAGWVRLEYDLFKTLLLNLLDNAMKSGGTEVRLTGEAGEGNYRISVADNGRGIPAEDLDKITEAFYMVDKSRSRKEHGAGLGLSLCQKIGELHGAALEFSSQPGQGTTVRVTLKRPEEDEHEA